VYSRSHLTDIFIVRLFLLLFLSSTSFAPYSALLSGPCNLHQVVRCPTFFLWTAPSPRDNAIIPPPQSPPTPLFEGFSPDLTFPSRQPPPSCISLFLFRPLEALVTESEKLPSLSQGRVTIRPFSDPINNYPCQGRLHSVQQLTLSPLFPTSDTGKVSLPFFRTHFVTDFVPVELFFSWTPFFLLHKSSI